MHKNFSKITTETLEIAHIAAAILKKGFSKQSYKISSKKGVHNLVTEYDLKAEKAIISAILKKYPDSSILSEEAGKNHKQNSLKWIIDPLDGTVNFAHHLPFFCVNIAVEIDNEIFCGVTISPLTNEVFVAEKGKGVFLNNKKIKVSSTNSLKKAIIATGFPYNIKNNPQKCVDRLNDFFKIGLPIRRFGSAALDLAYVAAGRFDGYFETNLGPWDCAAGLLFIKEAGGKITDWKGADFKLSDYNILVASNSKIHKSLIKILEKS